MISAGAEPLFECENLGTEFLQCIDSLTLCWGVGDEGLNHLWVL